MCLTRSTPVMFAAAPLAGGGLRAPAMIKTSMIITRDAGRRRTS